MLKIALRAPRGFDSLITASSKKLAKSLDTDIKTAYLNKKILYSSYGINDSAKLPHIVELNYNNYAELNNFNPEIAIINDTSYPFIGYNFNNKPNHITIGLGKYHSEQKVRLSPYIHYVSYMSAVTPESATKSCNKPIIRSNTIRMVLRDNLFESESDIREEQWEIVCELIKSYICYFRTIGSLRDDILRVRPKPLE